ncbi:MAG: hypothetical protein Q9219_002025 [cf. Caloplaca sp. 3 TL-2023]
MDSLRIMFELACVMFKRERYTDAEILFKDLLEMRQRLLGPEHPHTINTMAGLADVYPLQERLDDAEKLLEAVYDTVQRDSTTSNHRFNNMLNNLALVYLAQARFEAARDLLEKSLCDGEDEFGPDNLDHLNILDNLASTYEEWGQIDKAEDFFKRAFTLRVQTWGSEHPEALVAMIKFADFLESQKRYQEACTLARKVLNAKEAQLGSEKFETYRARFRVVRLLMYSSRFDEAAKILDKFILAESLSQETSIRHGLLLRAQYFLAICYHELQRHDDSAKLYELSLTGTEKLLGKEHFSLCPMLFSFDQLRCEEARYEEAQISFERCVKTIEDNKRSSALGEEDISVNEDDTYEKYYPGCVRSLADVFECLGQPERAELFLRECLSLAKTQFGTSSPSTSTILICIGDFLGKHSRYQEAIDLMLSALEVEQSHFGQSHVNTAAPLRRLAHAYSLSGMDEEAVPYFERAIPIMEREWGPEDPETINTVRVFLDTLHNIGGEKLIEERGTLREWAAKGVQFELASKVEEDSCGVDDEKSAVDEAHGRFFRKGPGQVKL